MAVFLLVAAYGLTVMRINILNVIRKHKVFVILALLFVFTRTIILVTEPVGAGFCEAFRATVAYDWITSQKFSLIDYLFRFNEGGSLILALLVGILFKLFGVSVMVLHVAPLLFSFLILCIGYDLLRRFCGQSDAILFGIFFIFIPQSYLTLSLIAWGTHVESALFVIAILFCFCRLILKPYVMNLSRFVYASLLGVVCGFSVWFCYTNVIAVIVVILCMFLYPRAFKSFSLVLTLLLSFLVGFLPAIAFTIFSHGSNWYIYSKPILSYFARCNLADIVHKAWELFARDLPQSLFFTSLPPVTRGVLCTIYYSLVLVAIVYVTGIELSGKEKENNEARRCIVIYSGLYFFVFCVLYASGEFSVDHSNLEQGKGFRYLAAFFPLFCIYLSMAFSSLQGFKKYILIASVIAPCVWGIASLVKPHNFLGNVSLNPFSYQSVGWSIGEKYSKNFSEALSYASKVDKVNRRFFFCGLAEGVTPRFIEEPAQSIIDFSNIPERYRRAFYLYIGYHTLFRESKEHAKVLSLLSLLDRRNVSFAYMGTGAYFALNDRGRLAEYKLLIPSEYHCAFFEGYGGGIAFISGYNAEVSISKVTDATEIPSELRGCAFKGIGLGMVTEENLSKSNLFLPMMRSAYMVPEQYRSEFLKGIAEARRLIREQLD